jgi:chromosome segregation ATPase
VSRCPICETEYIEEQGQLERCPTCQWNLTRYPIAIIISKILLNRELEKIEWAKSTWRRSKSQSLSKSDRDTYPDPVSDIYQQLKSSNNDKDRLESILEQGKRDLESLRSKFEQQQKDLYSSNDQVKQLENQLAKAQRRIEEITQLERMGRVALSEWLSSSLLDGFIAEIKSIIDTGKALTHINQLKQKWDDQTVHLIILKFVIEFLEKKQEEPRENLLLLLDKYQTVVVVDAILAIRAELKFHRIIQRDGTGDYFDGW